jgi:hypothetical protein
MKYSIVFRIILAFVVLAVVAGAAFLAFNAGLSYQLARSGDLPQAPVYGWGMHPHMGFAPFFFMPFGFLWCLIPLLLLGVVARIIRGPRWHDGHMHHRWGGPWSEEGVPPMFAEWHRRAHDEKTAEEK